MPWINCCENTFQWQHNIWMINCTAINSKIMLLGFYMKLEGNKYHNFRFNEIELLTWEGN